MIQENPIDVSISVYSISSLVVCGRKSAFRVYYLVGWHVGEYFGVGCFNCGLRLTRCLRPCPCFAKPVRSVKSISKHFIFAGRFRSSRHGEHITGEFNFSEMLLSPINGGSIFRGTRRGIASVILEWAVVLAHLQYNWKKILTRWGDVGC